MIPLGKEPTLIIQTIVAVLNAVQIAAISLPLWAHTVIVVVTIALGALVNRANVTPASPTP